MPNNERVTVLLKSLITGLINALYPPVMCCYLDFFPRHERSLNLIGIWYIISIHKFERSLSLYVTYLWCRINDDYTIISNCVDIYIYIIYIYIYGLTYNDIPNNMLVVCWSLTLWCISVTMVYVWPKFRF